MYDPVGIPVCISFIFLSAFINNCLLQAMNMVKKCIEDLVYPIMMKKITDKVGLWEATWINADTGCSLLLTDLTFYARKLCTLISMSMVQYWFLGCAGWKDGSCKERVGNLGELPQGSESIQRQQITI